MGTSGRSRNGGDQGGPPGRGVTEAKVHRRQARRPGSCWRHKTAKEVLPDVGSQGPRHVPLLQNGLFGGPHRGSHNHAASAVTTKRHLLSQPSHGVPSLALWSFPYMERNSAPTERGSGNGNTLTSSSPPPPSPTPGSGARNGVGAGRYR